MNGTQGKAEPLSLTALDSSPARGALLVRNRTGKATFVEVPIRCNRAGKATFVEEPY